MVNFALTQLRKSCDGLIADTLSTRIDHCDCRRCPTMGTAIAYVKTVELSEPFETNLVNETFHIYSDRGVHEARPLSLLFWLSKKINGDAPLPNFNQNGAMAFCCEARATKTSLKIANWYGTDRSHWDGSTRSQATLVAPAVYAHCLLLLHSQYGNCASTECPSLRPFSCSLAVVFSLSILHLKYSSHPTQIFHPIYYYHLPLFCATMTLAFTAKSTTPLGLGYDPNPP